MKAIIYIICALACLFQVSASEAHRDRDVAAADESSPLLITPAPVARGSAKKRYHLKAARTVNKKDMWGQTPLFSAAADNNLDRAMMLINMGADIEAKDWLSETPLFEAASSNSIDVVAFLLRRGADMHAETSLGWTPFLIAVTLDYSETLELMRDTMKQENMLLWETKRDGGLNVAERREFHVAHAVRVLLDHQAVSPRVRSVLGWNDFINSAYHGDTENVRRILMQQRNETIRWLFSRINKYDKVSARPLHYAAYNGHFEIVKLLVEHGAKVNAQDESGQTALHVAAQNGHAEIVNYLLSKGAEINLVDYRRRSPLYFAVLYGHLDVILVFSENHPNRASIRENRTGLLNLMMHFGHYDLVDVLVKSCVNFQNYSSGSQLLLLATVMGNTELVKLLLDKGAIYTSCGVKGRTLLHHAAK